MKLLTILVFAISILTGCKKEEMTFYKATLQNSTNRQIIILPYKNGIVFPEDTIKLAPNTMKVIADGYNRGIDETPGFSSTYFGGPSDSIVVFFDNIFKMTHYANLPQYTAPKYYPFTSTRNIGNPLSYQFTAVREAKNVQRNEHLYLFVEQDYLDTQ